LLESLQQQRVVDAIERRRQVEQRKQ